MREIAGAVNSKVAEVQLYGLLIIVYRAWSFLPWLYKVFPVLDQLAIQW